MDDLATAGMGSAPALQPANLPATSINCSSGAASRWPADGWSFLT